MARILSIGLDQDLLLTRESVLKQTGAFVRSTRPELAARMLKTENFGLIVLCHTIDPRDVEQICREVEETCLAGCVLSLAPFEVAHTSGHCVHVEFDWHNGPGALVRLARNLLQPVMATPKRSQKSGLHLIHQGALRV